MDSEWDGNVNGNGKRAAMDVGVSRVLMGKSGRYLGILPVGMYLGLVDST